MPVLETIKSIKEYGILAVCVISMYWFSNRLSLQDDKIERIENKLYDKFIDFDNIKLGIDISYYDVELGKRINLCVGSSFTSENNERLEAIIHSIQVGNRKRIEPSSNVILLSDDSSDMTDDSSDMEL